jgi:solute:Na+ symporter, SSS family
MHPFDWLLIVSYLTWVVYDGLRRTKAANRIEGYFLANRSLPWWAVGLSVMATQLSAITLTTTTGLGYAEGMRFIQFYFGLPLAMIILSVTVVPFFHRARVYTAYEYLEQRFDAKTRLLTSALFLASRAMSCGVVIAAPSVILSVVLGWDLNLTILAIGVPTVLYTMFGGVQAVTWADVKQMVVIVTGLIAVVIALILGLPEDVSVGEALHLAGATGRMQTMDFRFDLRETYTFWSGLIGGMFLALGYFGCDQSQVQRYLTAKSVDQARHSLLMSAYAKIPLQVLVLLVGVLVFVFYLFNEPPMLFHPVHERQVHQSPRAADYEALEADFRETFDRRRQAAARLASAERERPEALADARAQFIDSNRHLGEVRDRAAALTTEVTGERYGDVNYVFPTFVTTRLPIGLVGLIIAAIFAAAMSSVSSELNALSTASVIDFYRRHLRREASEREYLLVSKLATGFWGTMACIVAAHVVQLGALIEVVNRLGSFFYGSLLGVFVLAIGTRWATGRGAFYGLLAGMATVFTVNRFANLSFLWNNVIGVVAVVTVGFILSYTDPGRKRFIPKG